MEPVSFMFICVVAAKAGMAVLSVVGVTSGMNWMSKKLYVVGKKGGDNIEGDIEIKKFHRGDL